MSERPQPSVQRHFEQSPYPPESNSKQLFKSPKDLYAHSLATGFYLRDGLLPKGKLRVLDAGCGTGEKSIRLALVNPDVTILGIDFSASAIAIATERAKSVGVENVDFQEVSIDALSTSGQRFDYIHCDDTLYLLDDPRAALSSLGGLLAEGGILRANVHNLTTRQAYLRAGRAIGLVREVEQEHSALLGDVRTLYSTLREGTRLRKQTSKGLRVDAYVLANHALVGDKAFSLEETLDMISAAGLGLIGFVDMHRWHLDSVLSEESGDEEMLRRIRSLSPVDQLRFLDAVNYRGRLYDFWCTRGSFGDPITSFPKPRASSKLRLHPGALVAGIVQASTQLPAAGRYLQLEQFSPYASLMGKQPPQVQDLVSLLGHAEWSSAALLEQWRKLRPLQEAKAAEREMSLGLEALARAGLLFC